MSESKNFWLALVPAIALLLQAAGDIFGPLEFGVTIDKILVFINVLFCLLVLVRVVTPNDRWVIRIASELLGYDEPKK